MCKTLDIFISYEEWEQGYKHHVTPSSRIFNTVSPLMKTKQSNCSCVENAADNVN